MNVSEVNQKLHYVIELLGDLWHYQQPGVHACSCSVCTKKQSLARSIVTKVLQEVVLISNCFESNTNCTTESQQSNLNNSPNVLCATLPSEQDAENTVVKENVHKTGQRKTDVGINCSCPTLRNNKRDERKSSSTSSDSLRDSGLNTSLSSHSVSPISGGRYQHRNSDNTQLQVSELVSEMSSGELVNVAHSPHNASRVDVFSSNNRGGRLVSGSHCLSNVQANRSSHLPVRNLSTVEDDYPDVLDRQIITTDSQKCILDRQIVTTDSQKCILDRQIKAIPNREMVPTDSQTAQASFIQQSNQVRSSFASQGLMFVSFPLMSPPALMDKLEGCCRHSEQYFNNPNAGFENNTGEINQPFSHQAHSTQIAPTTSIQSSSSTHAHRQLTNSENDTSQLETDSLTKTDLEKFGFRRESFHHVSVQEAQLQDFVMQKIDMPLQDEHLHSSPRSHADEGCELDVNKPTPHCCQDSHAEPNLEYRRPLAGSNENKLHSSSTESVCCSLSQVTLKEKKQLCLSSLGCDNNDDIVDSCNHHHLISNGAVDDGCGCCVCGSELCGNTCRRDDFHCMWRPWQAKDMIMGLINTDVDEANCISHEASNAPMALHLDEHFINATDTKAAGSDTARMNDSTEDSMPVTTENNGINAALLQDVCSSEQHLVSSLEKRREGHGCSKPLDKKNSMRNVTETAPSFTCFSSDNTSLPHNVNLEHHNLNNLYIVGVDNDDAGMFVHSEKSNFDVTNIRVIHDHIPIDAVVSPKGDTVMKRKESPTSMDRSLKCLSNIIQSPKNNKSYIYNSSPTSPEVFSTCLSLDKENSHVSLQKPDLKSSTGKMYRIDILNTDKAIHHKQSTSLDDTLPAVTSVSSGEPSDVNVQRCSSPTLDKPVSRVHASQSRCNSVIQAGDKRVSLVQASQSQCNSVIQAVDKPVSHVHFIQPQCNPVTQKEDRSGELALATNQGLAAISHYSCPITSTSSSEIPWGAPAVVVEPEVHTEDKKTNLQVEKLRKAYQVEKCKPDSNKPVTRYSELKSDLSHKHCTSEVTSNPLQSGDYVPSVSCGEVMETNGPVKMTQRKSSHLGNHVTFKRDSSAEVVKTNGSLKETWKEFAVMKAGRNNLNQTLPACRTLETSNASSHRIINDSYEVNQSFPKVTRSQQSAAVVRGDQTAAAACSHGVAVDIHQLSSEWPSKPVPRNRRSIFGVSPSDSHSSPERLKPDANFKGQVAACDQKRKSTSADESGLRELWSLLDVSEDIGQIPSVQEVLFNCVTSSLCIVDSERNGKILSLNESFQFLIGVHEKVVGQKLFRFIKFRDYVSSALGQSLPQCFVLADGHITSITGKLAHCVNACGEAIPVSVWTVPFQPQPTWTVCVVGVAVPMQTDIYLSGRGQVLMYSQPFEDILGSTKEGEKVTHRIPDVDYSQGGKPQHISLETKDGCYIPVTVTLGNDESLDTEITRNNSKADIYPAVLSISMNMSGLVVADQDGVIRFCDKNYFRINLGHSHLEEKHQVSDFLSEIMRVSPSSSASSPDSSPVLEGRDNTLGSNMALADVSCLQSGDPCSVKDRNTPTNDFYLPQSCFSSRGLVDLDDSATGESDDEDRGSRSIMEESGGQDCLRLPQATVPYQTSTPCKGRDLSKRDEQKDVLMENGTYVALFLHGNGTYVPVTFKLSHIQTSCETLFCLWMCIMPAGSKECADSDHSTDDSQDDDDEGESEAACTFDEEELGNHFRNLHLNKPEDTSLSQIIMDQAGFNQSHNATSDADLLDLEVAVNGSFGSRYAVCEALGQGSFGFVRRAKILGSASTVVVKFIKKSNMFEDSWISNENTGKMIPLEVSILRETYNDHIIKLLDFHENDSFVQMVMEDFGETDLFDFIDQVDIDEPLACYLFRQILWAVDYLHSKNIIHRDIKDENVIVSRSFHCKLIDFGSATYMLPEGETFTKFRGTLEYCSPEVHNGAKYRGPELDIWALGVTLYTILFRENPFTASEVPGSLNGLPHPITEDALTLLLGLLQPDPLKRFTVLRALSCNWIRQIVDLNDYSWCDLFGDVPAQSDSMFELGIEY